MVHGLVPRLHHDHTHQFLQLPTAAKWLHSARTAPNPAPMLACKQAIVYQQLPP